MKLSATDIHFKARARASVGFFPGGATLNFSSGKTVVKIHFTHSKLWEQPFLLKIKIGKHQISISKDGQLSPYDAHKRETKPSMHLFSATTDPPWQRCPRGSHPTGPRLWPDDRAFEQRQRMLCSPPPICRSMQGTYPSEHRTQQSSRWWSTSNWSTRSLPDPEQHATAA